MQCNKNHREFSVKKRSMGKPFPLVMTQRVRDNDNAANTSIVGASCVRVGKAGHTADSIQAIENSIFCETEEEKCQFLLDSLEGKHILNYFWF